MSAFSKSKQLLGFLGCFCLSYLTGVVGSIASVQARTFYAELTQPAWAPPGWLFGPVWSLLYLMMAISAWLVWRRSGIAAARMALGLFVIQLVVNALWSWLFFAWHLGAAAFVDILLLLGLIVLTMVHFWKHSRLATCLLIPYFCWVCFAAFLNFSFWQLNPGLLG